VLFVHNFFFSFLKVSSVSTEVTESAEITEGTECIERTKRTESTEITESTESLQQIFPCKSRDELAEVMRSSSSLEEATNRLLDAQNILLERGTLPIIFEVNLLSLGEGEFPYRYMCSPKG